MDDEEKKLSLHEGGIITFFFFGFDDILPSSGGSLGCFFSVGLIEIN